MFLLLLKVIYNIHVLYATHYLLYMIVLYTTNKERNNTNHTFKYELVNAYRGYTNDITSLPYIPTSRMTKFRIFLRSGKRVVGSTVIPEMQAARGLCCQYIISFFAIIIASARLDSLDDLLRIA